MTGYQNIIDALIELGDTCYDVGRRLVEMDCKGWKEEGAACPVYHYLTLVKRIEGIERVVADEVWIHDGPLDEPGTEPTGRIQLPLPVHQFVRSFDEGEWPQLERHG